MTEISILLPTRGRTETLKTSINSLLATAKNPQDLEILLAFDHDDQDSFDWFENNVSHDITQSGSMYTAWGFTKLGYQRLNEYVNFLAGKSHGKWLLFWNDDARMETPEWDSVITAVQQFRVLRMPTHRDHPYAIFPIVPRSWYELFGYVSPHQLSDAWVSQLAYLLDIMQNIDVSVSHDRYDITGNNQDDTWKNRVMLEGNPDSPLDFNHVSYRNLRMIDAVRLRDYLKEQGEDMSWFDRVRQGKQDPWQRMMSEEQDPNRQIKRI
jgi:glycosyltransferase involved in cell wall biosynthesis